jgi:AraC-like DNA-binding protein
MNITLEKISSGKNESYIAKRYDDEDFASPRHFHDEYELILIEESNGRLFAGNSIINYREGELYLFAPGMVHSFKNKKEKGKKAIALILLFKKDFLGREFINRKESLLLKRMFENAEKGIRFEKPGKEIVSLIKKSVSKEGIPGVIDFISLLDLLSRHKKALLLTNNQSIKYYYRLNYDKLHELLQEVEKNYHSGNIYELMLKKTGMSSPSFSRYFKHKTGKTFIQYLNEVRISQAQKMLIETNEKIKKIAAECGFPKQVYFNRIFKIMNGVAPNKFRKNFLSI